MDRIINIMIAGVGGQGLVLTTDLIANAAFNEGFEVQTNDVIGLSQRGGKIYGSVRYGKSVPTPIVPSHSVDVLIALEELEGLRYVDEVRKEGIVVLNKKQIFPNPVLLEKAQYPQDIKEQISSRGVTLIPVATEDDARDLGNIKVANTILLGVLSNFLDISEENWRKAIEAKVPKKTIEANIKAFEHGVKIGQEYKK